VRHLTLLLLAAACTAAPDGPLSFDGSDDVRDLGWTEPTPDAPVMPPPPGSLAQAHAAMVGAPIDLQVGGIPAGATVLLVASLQGPGVGPCHPSGVCVGVLSPRLLSSTVASAAGQAAFQVTPPGAGFVAFQAVVLSPTGNGTTSVLETDVASVDVAWAYDQVQVTVDHGESGYFFGSAETFAGYLGWYGEDCLPFSMCHPMGSSLVLTSEHPDVGGAGVPAVASGLTTLFYDIHDPYVTYYLEGLDSGDCWAWGDDPSYYPGCTPLN